MDTHHLTAQAVGGPSRADYGRLEAILGGLDMPWVIDALRNSDYQFAGATEEEATFVAEEGCTFVLRPRDIQYAAGARRRIAAARRWLAGRRRLVGCLALATLATALWYLSWVTIVFLLSSLWASYEAYSASNQKLEDALRKDLEARLVAQRKATARGRLLKRHQEVLRALNPAKREKCTFLSVDVVGAAQMKVGEEVDLIATTFQAYEEMLRRIFQRYGAWKLSGTPGNVMACFLDRSLAIRAAQGILLSLKKFNKTGNKLHTPFRVRCGLDEGEVAIYEDGRLERIPDIAINIAGDLRRHGRPNTLCLPEDVFETLPDKTGFKTTDAVVDGHPVYEWAPAGS